MIKILINGPEFLYSLPNVVALQPQVLEPLSASIKKLQTAPPLAPTLSSTMPPPAMPPAPSPPLPLQQQMHSQVPGRRMPQQVQQRFSAGAHSAQTDMRRPNSSEYHMVSPTMNTNHYQVIPPSPPELLPSLTPQVHDMNHRHGFAEAPPLTTSVPHLNSQDGISQPSISDAYHVRSNSSLSSLSSTGHHNDTFPVLSPPMSVDANMRVPTSAPPFSVVSPPLEQVISPAHSTHTQNQIQHAQYGVTTPPLQQSFSSSHSSNHTPIAQHRAQFGGAATLEASVPHSANLPHHIQHSHLSASAPEFHVPGRFSAPSHSGPLSSDVTFPMLSAPVDMAADLNNSFSSTILYFMIV